jgi:hypothetical protein
MIDLLLNILVVGGVVGLFILLGCIAANGV